MGDIVLKQSYQRFRKKKLQGHLNGQKNFENISGYFVMNILTWTHCVTISTDGAAALTRSNIE